MSVNGYFATFKQDTLQYKGIIAKTLDTLQICTILDHFHGSKLRSKAGQHKKPTYYTTPKPPKPTKPKKYIYYLAIKIVITLNKKKNILC